MDFESGIEQWLRSPDRVMEFVCFSLVHVDSPGSVQAAAKEFVEGVGAYLLEKGERAFFYREIESIR